MSVGLAFLLKFIWIYDSRFYFWLFSLCYFPYSAFPPVDPFTKNLLLDNFLLNNEKLVLRAKERLFVDTIYTLSDGERLSILNCASVEKIGFKLGKRAENLSEWRNPRN